jgi:hypothetical protein
MRVVVLLATAVAAVVAAAIWRSRHSVEVWHAAADVPA